MIRCVPLIFMIFSCTAWNCDGAAEEQKPLNNAEWTAFRAEILIATGRGDFRTASQAAEALHAKCAFLGSKHPDAMAARATLVMSRALKKANAHTQDRFLSADACISRGWKIVEGQFEQSLPDVEALRECITRFCSDASAIPPHLPLASAMNADRTFGIACCLALARMMPEAEKYADLAKKQYTADEGAEMVGLYAQLLLADLLREQRKEPGRQVALLQGIITFVERYQTTDRLRWWKMRATAELAEVHFWLGNREEADRLYARVRQELPDKIDHSVPGWCKSWCDRHEARRLMEKGDWEGAYQKILQARVGTIDYGHRNLSKGLTMERILRMSAEIQRERGNAKEADKDLEYAEMIADHAGELRVALESELDALENSKKDTILQSSGGVSRANVR